MKILVHLNHGSNKSYMLHFGKQVKKDELVKILQLSQEDAAQGIYGYAGLFKSVEKTVVPQEDRKRATLEADVVVGHQ